MRKNGDIAGRLGDRVESTRRGHSKSVTGIVGVQLHFASAVALRLTSPPRSTISVVRDADAAATVIHRLRAALSPVNSMRAVEIAGSRALIAEEQEREP
jgi:hypothetical protein